MSGTGESLQDFAGEERAFRIRLGEIRRIEAKCECGIGLVLGRLSRAVVLIGQMGGVQAFAAGIDLKADDVRTTLYEGLVGAGMSAGDATKLIRQEIDERGVRGLVDNVAVAFAVMWASQETPGEGAAPGERQAGESPATSASGPTSPASTEPAPRSGSARAKSTSSRRGSSTPRSKAGAKPTPPKKARSRRRPPSTTS